MLVKSAIIGIEQYQKAIMTIGFQPERLVEIDVCQSDRSPSTLPIR
jgi:hypothetical protein